VRSSETPPEVIRAIARAHNEEWAYVLAATVRVTRNLDLAEDCVQDAYARALVNWPANGIPRRPGAWLTTVARRRALERLRRATTLARKLPSSSSMTSPACRLRAGTQRPFRTTVSA